VVCVFVNQCSEAMAGQAASGWPLPGGVPHLKCCPLRVTARGLLQLLVIIILIITFLWCHKV